jgi:hypothetical protein
MKNHLSTRFVRRPVGIHLITPYTHIGSVPGGHLFSRSSAQVTTHGLHPMIKKKRIKSVTKIR